MPDKLYTEKASPTLEPKHVIETSQYGVWRMKMEQPTSYLSLFMQPNLLARRFQSILPTLRRFLSEIYSVAPILLLMYLLLQIIEGLDDVITLYLSTRVLKAIEEGLKTGNMDAQKIITAVMMRYAVMVVGTHLSWYGSCIRDRLRIHVQRYYELYMMNINLSIDLPTSQSPVSQQGVGSAEEAWITFENLVSFCQAALSAVSQAAFTAGLATGATFVGGELIVGANSQGGGVENGGGWQLGGSKMFLALSFVQPLFRVGWGVDSFWGRVVLAVADNPHYKRMKALDEFASGTYRQDIISGGLKNWILDEYEKAHRQLGSVSDEDILLQYLRGQSPWFDTISNIFGELPMTYCTIMALLNPSLYSISSFAMVQQSSSQIYSSVRLCFDQFTRFRVNVQFLSKLYARDHITNSVVDGKIEYPRAADPTSMGGPNESLDYEVKAKDVHVYDFANATNGMSFDLKNVSFFYPGSENLCLSPALRSISLSIQAGELVLIVGANGSGKSTVVKLLSRLYDPSSGLMLIDGLQSNAYTLSSLHAASAILSQEAQIYPLTLAENIGLGYTPLSADRDTIIQSAKEGGAWDVLNKFKDGGLDSVLNARPEAISWNVYDQPEHPLYKEMEELPKNVRLSGGEEQRIVAARTFMRFRSGLIRFVAVDEPSSALDAEGEFMLFRKLIEHRQGKTIVFVTHRFGDLVKLADKIICMKDGSIVEIGKHDELLDRQGEYAKLYAIQARAYSNNSDKEMDSNFVHTACDETYN